VCSLLCPSLTKTLCFRQLFQKFNYDDQGIFEHISELLEECKTLEYHEDDDQEEGDEEMDGDDDGEEGEWEDADDGDEEGDVKEMES